MPRKEFWNKHEFEAALNLEISNETYAQTKFCYIVLEPMFPDRHSILSYYRLNGEDGISKLYQVALHLHNLEDLLSFLC